MTVTTSLYQKGRLDTTDVASLLRQFEKEKSSGELSFQRDRERAELYFLFGQLYHARRGKNSGLEVVRELLGWRSGSFTFNEGVIPTEASISVSMDQILSEKFTAAATYSEPPVEMLVAPTPAAPANGRGDVRSFKLTELGFASIATAPAGLPEVNSVVASGIVAPPPPSGGLYSTRTVCLPVGQQLSTSLLLTGPQLREEILQLAAGRFTGYIIGGPEVNGFPNIGLCMLRGRFIHAFYHIQNERGGQAIEGEQAYLMAVDPQENSAGRYYWFYDLPQDVTRAAIALLTPPQRYSRLEMRIVRFKEMLRMLNEESFTGAIKLTIPVESARPDNYGSPAVLERAYVPLYQGNILGIWSEKNSSLAHDAQLLQRFISDPQAYLDLHTTVAVEEPGLMVEQLAAGLNRPPVAVGEEAASRPAVVAAARPAPLPAPQPVEVGGSRLGDDELQMMLIGSVGRMEATWAQMQKKGRLDSRAKLLALAGFVSEVLSLVESAVERAGLQKLLGRTLEQELKPHRAILEKLGAPQGRVNLGVLLKEYQEAGSSDAFGREAGLAFRAALGCLFQHYVEQFRSPEIEAESRDIYEVFLQDVVVKI